MLKSIRTDFLPFYTPDIGDAEIDAVTRILRSGWLTTGPETQRFEQAFAQFVGAQSALALNSGTAALHVGLKALGVGPGDAVITSTMTFCSAVNVIEQVGAAPILVDVEPDTLNIDPEDVSAAVATNQTARVRALMPTHLYGHPSAISALLDIAKRHDLRVLEDSAHSLAAAFRGRPVGTPPDGQTGTRVLNAFSFYATKNLTTGEGGMLTGPREIIDDARVWSLHGMNRDAWKRYANEGSWRYEVLRAGFKYNMTDLQAAIGLAQLRRLLALQGRRQKIVARYQEAFANLQEIDRPTVRADVEHAWHLYVIRLRLECLTISREVFIDELRLRNIGSSVHFIPVHLHPYYRDKYGYHPDDFPVAYREYQRIVSLPLFPAMTDADVDDVIGAVLDISRRFRR